MAALVQASHPGVTWWCPQLPASPAQAMALLLQGTAAWPRGQMAVMGSSLGGFYAAWLSAHLGVPAVLINPAVHPSRDLARYIGFVNTNQETDMKTVLITGCSSGIGKALALEAKQQGYRVFATARKEADLAQLRQLGLETIALEITSSDSLQQAVSQLQQQHKLDRCRFKNRLSPGSYSKLNRWW